MLLLKEAKIELTFYTKQGLYCVVVALEFIWQNN